MSNRAKQIAEVIQRELNNFFIREVEFPKDSLATLISVEVTPDLKHAMLYVSILPISKTGSVLEVLNRSLGRARGYLSNKLTIRKCPELKIIVDDYELQHRKIDKKLAEINKLDINQKE